MHILQIIAILKAHSRVVVATFIASLLTTVSVSLLLPKTYKATSTIVLNYKGTDPVTGHTLPAHLVQGIMATQVDVIKSQNVAQRVVDMLKLAEAEGQPSGGKQSQEQRSLRMAKELASRIEVRPSPESSVIEISVSDADPIRAAKLTNAVVAAYQQASLQLKVEPLRKASAYFDEQIKALHNKYQLAQARLATYQRDKGIISADRQYDVETARLGDLSAQLAAVQAQLREASLRYHQVKKGGENVAPEVIGNSLVHSLSNSVAMAEARFSEVGQKLGTSHPTYQTAKAELERLRASLAASKAAIATSLANTVEVLQQRQADLQSALGKQTDRVLELNFARGEMAVLARDLENTQRVYEVAAQRFAQINLEGKSDLTDVAILNPATVPLAAANPNVTTNASISAVIGILLGCGAAVLIELIDRKVRSTIDLRWALNAPLLGAIVRNDDTASMKRKLQRMMLRPLRLAVGP